MIAIDTCVLVRLLADDDPVQAEQAQSLMHEATVFLSNTVLIETEWVLRSRYKKKREEILKFFVLLDDVGNVVVEDTSRYRNAVNWYALGADFSDAIHLSVCGHAVMHTFDRDFCKAARDKGEAPAVQIIGSS